MHRKTLIKAATEANTNTVKIIGKNSGKPLEVVNKLMEIAPEIFEGVSKIEIEDYYGREDAIALTFYYGRRKGSYYAVELGATDRELEELIEEIYENEAPNRRKRRQEMKLSNRLAAGGEVKLSANALVSRLIKNELHLTTERDPSGRNAGWVYYVGFNGSEEEEAEFYDTTFLPYLEEVKSMYPDLHINSQLTGYGPRLKVYGPDYAWNKATKNATPI